MPKDRLKPRIQHNTASAPKLRHALHIMTDLLLLKGRKPVAELRPLPAGRLDTNNVLGRDMLHDQNAHAKTPRQ